jgi:hypothetical protein
VERGDRDLDGGLGGAAVAGRQDLEGVQSG